MRRIGKIRKIGGTGRRVKGIKRGWKFEIREKKKTAIIMNKVYFSNFNSGPSGTAVIIPEAT